MSNKFFLIFFLASGFSSFALSQDITSGSCPQQNQKFLEVAKDYNSCNSITGSNPQACTRFCESADRMLRDGGFPGGSSTNSCSPEQIRQLQAEARAQGINQGKQEGRNEVIRDLSVREDFISLDFYGINEEDCATRAKSNSQNLRLEAIRRCNDKAIAIKNCTVQNEVVNGSFGRPPLFEALGNFNREDNRSTEEECRTTALAIATQTALRNCLTATGNSCTIIPTETNVTHRLQAPSGPRLGRRDKRICDARVVAEAPKDLTYKCNLRISARNQISPN
jgi:hypothetical protein